MQIEQGGFVAPRAPYGYQKSSDNCHQLELDKTAAAYVRSIFELAILNVGLNEVVRRLNVENIPAPMQYATANGLSGNYEQGNGLWNTRSLKKILTNITLYRRVHSREKQYTGRKYTSSDCFQRAV